MKPCHFVSIIILVTFVMISCSSTSSVIPLPSDDLQNWPKKGCYRVGHVRTITIPDCEPVQVVLNACRGNCPSYAVPSLDATKKISSYSLCCRMTKHEEVGFLVNCVNGVRELKFPSALECKCFDCSHQI